MFVPKPNKILITTKSRGFTLIELTIGIAVLSVALLVMTGALFPQAARSTEPWTQVRSAELAHSMMNEILAKRFDENSFTTGDLRCGEDEGGTPADDCITNDDLTDCTQATGFKFREEASREDYDDVDDYNCSTYSGITLTDLTGNQALADIYDNYQISVQVSYITENQLKQIMVTVTPPLGDSIVYTAYKANY